MNTVHIPNPAQLRTMAHPAHQPKPCEAWKHCERQARDLGACVCGQCNRPADGDSTPAANDGQAQAAA